MKPSNLSGKLTDLHFLGYKIVSVTKAIMGFGIVMFTGVGVEGTWDY